jgi:type II secretory pathway predicted ATPase ExeA
MYQQFYGLRELPFELTPNPRYLFLPRQHREALSTLVYGLSSAKGLAALIGEAGMGKTTLLHAALQSESCRHVRSVFVVNPTLTRAEFIEMLSMQFDLSARAAQSKTMLLSELESSLRERRERGEHTALVIDEAQSLSGELLEEIRLLANTETATEKLLSVVLSGQPELRDRLNERELRQLKQRVTLRCELTPFTLQETAAYIASRIQTAGGDAARLFTRQAVMLIHERSRGIARTISVLCDNALLTGMGLGRQPVTYNMVLEVARDFDLQAAPHDVAQPEPTLSAAPDTSPSGVTLTFAPAPVPTEPTPPAALTHEPEDNRQMFAAAKPRARFSLFGTR